MSTPSYESLSSATAGPDWMKRVPDSTNLGAMSIPGTHESLSTFGGDSTQTQEGDSTQAGNLAGQLAAGVRAFDIRVRVVGGQSKSNGDYLAGSYAVHHGVVYQHAMLGDALDQFRTFLAGHPGETLLLRLKAECSGSGTSCTDDLTDTEAPPTYDSDGVPIPATPSDNAKTAYRQNLFSQYVTQYHDLFYGPSVASTATSVSQGEVPTLGAVRGKLVLTAFYGPGGGDYQWGLKQDSGLQNNAGASLAGGDCGDSTDSDNHGCFVQDQYNVPNMMAIASKRNYVRRQLDRQNSDPDQDRKLYINYTSGASAFAYPYSVASGCAAQICTSQGVNEFLLTYLNQATGTHAPVVRTGVVMMDFPGGALIDKIVGYNFFNPGTGGTGSTTAPSASTRKADSFLLNAIDQHGAQDALRVPQSYQGGFFGPGDKFGPTGYQASFTYDNAVTVMALLTNHSGTDFSHAIALGDSLLYAQDHDPVNDGRIRASYLPDPFITTLGRDYPVGTPYIAGWSVYTGNMAWAGMAFAHLYKATGDSKYLNGALRAANWIQANSADTRGAGGYTGGYADTSAAEDGSGMVQRTWKATEHNIDVGAFFAMLHQLTGDLTWKNRSDNAFAFVRTMQAPNKSLWTGTGLDGVTTNEDAVPEDVQTWSYLATLDPAYAPSVDFAAGRMAASDGGFTGVSFSAVDTSGVWFEGTAHLLAAYQARNAPGDAARAAALIATLQHAQNAAPNADGSGIVASSHDGLDTGQGDYYYSSLHTGATAWYLIGALGGNPFRL